MLRGEDLCASHLQILKTTPPGQKLKEACYDHVRKNFHKIGCPMVGGVTLRNGEVFIHEGLPGAGQQTLAVPTMIIIMNTSARFQS